jgi:tetratricopeptide (TPR) repeat protein
VYEGETLRVTQFFLRDPAEEPAMLDALEAFLTPAKALVTFNGKTFDLPLLRARYTANRRDFPFVERPHIDLLSLARRLWRSRLPSRAMSCLEQQVLAVRRTGADVPGWMIPELYFDYLRDGDARPLEGIFYHNAVDVLSMAALLSHATTLLADPLAESVPALDQADAAWLLEELGHVETAARTYERALSGALPGDARAQVVRRWSFLEKRRGRLEAAMALWRQAANDGHLYAYEELAKAYEHHKRDHRAAARWTQDALEHLDAAEPHRFEHARWAEALTHRLARLQRKLSATRGQTPHTEEQ